MQKIIQKSMSKIIKRFSCLNRVTKKMIFIGLGLFLAIFAAGTALMGINRLLIPFDPYLEYISVEIVNKSFMILAEVVIGCLLVDYIFKR